jgi:hypothetical protein
LNKQLREGFVRDDEADATEAKVIEHMPARAPVVEPSPRSAKARPEAEAPPPFDPDKDEEDDVVWPLRLKLLRKPTRNMKNEIIHELELRAPTARDIRQCGGNPVRYDNNFNVITDNDRMMQMVALLSGLHLPMVDQLDAHDWSSISFYMQRFFFAG